MGHTMSRAAHLRGFRRDDESRRVSECPGAATSVATVRAVDESPKFLEVLWQYGSEDQKIHLSHGGVREGGGTLRGQNVDIGKRGRYVDLASKCGASLWVEAPPIPPS